MESSDISSDESHNPSIKKTHICTHEGCNASFAKNSKLVYHIRRHTGERPFACDELNCNKTYLYSFHLRRHKETYHIKKPIERITCTFEGCYMELANKYSLKKHIKVKHNPERSYPFSCVECKQGFCKKKQLLKHSYIHTGIFPLKCDLCELGFLSTVDLNRHKRTHTNYSCECAMNFERWSNLLKHKKKCELLCKRLKCGICDKTFKQRMTLKTHLELHIKDDSNVYKCGYENCARSYSYKKNLIYHINKHHKKVVLPRIACTYDTCGKTFITKQNLKQHLKRVHIANSTTEKKPRKPRKDKGTTKTSTASKLLGISLPLEMEKKIIKGLPVKLSDFEKNIRQKSEKESSTSTAVSEHISTCSLQENHDNNKCNLVENCCA